MYFVIWILALIVAVGGFATYGVGITALLAVFVAAGLALAGEYLRTRP
jgi:hypothetical protein